MSLPRAQRTATSIRGFGSKGSLISTDDLDGAKKELWGARHTLAVLGVTGFALVYAMRVNLSVAIVAMVRHLPANGTGAAGNGTGNDTGMDELACPLPDSSDDGSYGKDGEFDWDEAQQGLVLGSFYYGYMCTNLLGGLASERWGGRLVMGIGVLLTGLLTMLTAVVARMSFEAFVVLRIMEGLAEGVTFPAMNNLLAAWILPDQRSQYSSFVFAGAQFGTVITLAVSGIMCDSTFLGGWPSVFYVFGGLGVVWAAFWFPLVRNSPAEHPRISEYERKFLREVTLINSDGSKDVPWRAVVTSVPMWGTLIAHVGYNWTFYALLTELPTYLSEIQHYSLSSNGLLSALPYAIMYVFSQIYGQLMGMLAKAGTLSLVNIRRMSMAITGYLPMLSLVGLCFVGCDRTLAIVVLCVAVGTCGAVYSCYICSHSDMAPRYAGTLMGITNTFATIPGFVTPAIAGALTNGNQTLAAWQTVFLMAAGVTGFAATVYILTIRADIQEWNYYGTDTYEMKMKKKSQSQSSDTRKNSSIKESPHRF